MTHDLRPSLRSLTLTPVLLACLLIGFECTLQAQAPRPAPPAKTHSTIPVRAESRTIPALLVSDIHFDPFHDPARMRELVSAPVTEWRSILSEPPSSNQAQAFASLQQNCNARGIDTPFALLHSSLQAMKAHQPDAKFMAVSGDLIAHAFTCRYSTLFPDSAPADYQAFVLKTLSFVVAELRATFPGMPIYAGLGNNDSGCGDYQFDAGSDFLSGAGKIITDGLPPLQQEGAIKEFADGGYYSVTMAEPMHDTRLIVVNDLFFSPKYSTCAGKPDSAAASRQLSWLQQQLAQARESHQRVWVVGHIPPGIDPYSTMSRFRDVCGGQSPVMFLSSDKMADLMVEYADVVQLGVFGHTHMDEVRLLQSLGAEPQNAEAHLAAIKVVPSISPVDGNNPSFTVARVNPASAVLENFEVIAASNQTGIATVWAKEYDFAQTFHQAQFSPLTVKKMIDGFSLDHGANTPASEAYLRHYFVGDRAALLSPFWPQYVCALNNYTAKGYAACVCSTTK
jgi:sphingomyelin phosphodiesterase acid-like 3